MSRTQALRPFLQDQFSERGTGSGPLRGRAGTVEAADRGRGSGLRATQQHGAPRSGRRASGCCRRKTHQLRHRRGAPLRAAPGVPVPSAL